MPKFNDRIGETRIANNGLKMTIVAYHNANNIDVQFEDGTIIKHKQYNCFIRGRIAHPTIISPNILCPKISDRVGESKIANNGLKMTIIEYKNERNIFVQFEDGTIVGPRSYGNFKNGSISHPDDGKFGINVTRAKYKNRYIGQEVTKSNGETMKIIEYNNNHDYKVQFQDGTIVHQRGGSISDFYDGYIRNPNYYSNINVGKENIAKNGLKMTIIEYNSNSSIIVRFEDGAIVKTNIRSFREGGVKHPNLNPHVKKAKEKYIGKIFTAKNGMKYKVIDYQKADNILIEFEDGTKTKTNVSAICSGAILNPNYNIKTIRIGETNTSFIGMQMIIIAYHTAKDIDIQFEDGCVVKHKSYSSFKKSTIKHEFPYQMDDMIIEKPAYAHNKIGNFYCHCTLCGKRDIMTVSEAKDHVCVLE